MNYTLYNGDCLIEMNKIEDKSVDMILCDLPYETTSLSWDTIIPFEDLWNQYKRIIKDRGAIVLTSAQPFTSKLVMSNIEWFKYSWIWVKNQAGGFAQAKNKPMPKHEDILVFSNGKTIHASQSLNRMNYNPQGLIKIDKETKNSNSLKPSAFEKRKSHKESYIQEFTGYPDSILMFDCQREGLHPTQKPVELMEYLIKTYTNKGDIVLDNTMGSGTTGVACMNTNRNFIGIEMDEKYFNISKDRIKESYDKNFLFNDLFE